MISTLLIVICMVFTFLYFLIKTLLFKMLIPTILDIPHYLKNNFNVVSGYARDNANGKGDKTKNLIICINTGTLSNTKENYH